MPRFVAFLRAINVGGRNVTMEVLREHFAALGFVGVETFIASGNVIFQTSRRVGKAADRVLEEKIEGKLHEALGYEVATFVRSLKEVAAIAAYRPFAEQQLSTAGAFNVAFLAQALPDAERALEPFRSEIDDFHAHGREVYWLCRRKQSESTFSNARFEKTLKIRATFRSMTTVRKLAAKYPD